MPLQEDKQPSAVYRFQPNMTILRSLFKDDTNNISMQLNFQYDAQLFKGCGVHWEFMTSLAMGHSLKVREWKCDDQYYTIDLLLDSLVAAMLKDRVEFESRNITPPQLSYDKLMLQNNHIVKINIDYAMGNGGTSDIQADRPKNIIRFYGNELLRALGLTQDQYVKSIEQCEESSPGHGWTPYFMGFRPFYIRVYKQINVMMSAQQFYIYDPNGVRQRIVMQQINTVQSGDYASVNNNFNISAMSVQDLSDFTIEIRDELYLLCKRFTSVSVLLQSQDTVKQNFELIKIR